MTFDREALVIDRLNDPKSVLSNADREWLLAQLRERDTLRAALEVRRSPAELKRNGLDSEPFPMSPEGEA